MLSSPQSRHLMLLTPRYGSSLYSCHLGWVTVSTRTLFKIFTPGVFGVGDGGRGLAMVKFLRPRGGFTGLLVPFSEWRVKIWGILKKCSRMLRGRGKGRGWGSPSQTHIHLGEVAIYVVTSYCRLPTPIHEKRFCYFLRLPSLNCFSCFICSTSQEKRG